MYGSILHEVKEQAKLIYPDGNQNTGEKGPYWLEWGTREICLDPGGGYWDIYIYIYALKVTYLYTEDLCFTVYNSYSNLKKNGWK